MTVGKVNVHLTLERVTFKRLGLELLYNPGFPSLPNRQRTLCPPTWIVAQPIFIADLFKITMKLNHPGC